MVLMHSRNGIYLANEGVITVEIEIGNTIRLHGVVNLVAGVVGVGRGDNMGFLHTLTLYVGICIN